MRPLHTSLNTANSGCKPRLIRVFFYTFSPCLPTPAHTSHPCHHHISKSRHPIISVLTFHMPKPLLSTTPHHFCHALNTQKTVQVLTSLPILQRHTTHPSHHHALCSLQAMQILSLHCPCLNPICQHALDTGPKIFPFMRCDAPWAIRMGDSSLNLAQAHHTLALAASSTPPPAPSVSPK